MRKANLLEAQLFLDDSWVAESCRVGRTWHTARKRHEPVLKPTEPWEGTLICAYGSVLLHDGKFKIWYVAFKRPTTRVCYAESADGIHWVKPRLGLVEYDGSRENNILFQFENVVIDCLGVIDDPDDRKYPLKMIYWRNGPEKQRGLVAARSVDGIHWEHKPGLVLPDWGDRTNVMPAKDNGKYVVFGRYNRHFQIYRDKYGTTVRVVSRTESEDLVHWSKPELVLTPDLEDDPYMEMYSATAFRYESMYVGLIERMHMSPDVLDPEIWFSHDGYSWSRSRERKTFIRRGPEDSWDCGWVNGTSNAPIPFEHELLIHYSGRAHGHTYPPSYRIGAIGVAHLRIDGFCSLRATEKQGIVVTHPMRWPEAELALNADPRRDIQSHPRFCNGQVLVEVRTARGEPVKGFTFADCVELRHNTYQEPMCAKVIEWKEGRRMASLAGRVVRLAFALRDAHLYSFRAVKTESLGK